MFSKTDLLIFANHICKYFQNKINFFAFCSRLCIVLLQCNKLQFFILKNLFTIVVYFRPKRGLVSSNKVNVISYSYQNKLLTEEALKFNNDDGRIT